MSEDDEGREMESGACVSEEPRAVYCYAAVPALNHTWSMTELISMRCISGTVVTGSVWR